MMNRIYILYVNGVYINININLVYLTYTIDKPHNNSVYIFEYFSAWEWLGTVVETSRSTLLFKYWCS